MKKIIKFIAIIIVFFTFVYGTIIINNRTVHIHDREMYEQINIGDFYQIKCICVTSCDVHHIVQISNKRIQNLSEKYLIDIQLIDANDNDKRIDFTYDIDTFMSVFEPIKIHLNE